VSASPRKGEALAFLSATFRVVGVFDFVKLGTEEMRLARPSGTHEPVVLLGESSLPVWGLLDVEPNEVAAFVRDGKVIGLVGPGRHSVHASKLAFLEGIADDKGRLPLSLAFVRLSPLEHVPFSAVLDRLEGRKCRRATCTPADPLVDPGALDAVRPLVDGDLTVQVIDPVAFVEEHLEGANKPLLARRGIVVTIDGVRLALEGRRVPVYAGASLSRRNERRVTAVAESGRALACKGCGEMGEAGRFCAGCGSLLTEHEQCVACRAELASGARFCLACGARVAR